MMMKRDGLVPMTRAETDAYRAARAKVIAAYRPPTASQTSRMSRVGEVAHHAVTLADHFRADREAAETQDARDLVWRTYILSLMVELYRRGEGGLYAKPRRSKVDATLPVITFGQHEWDPDRDGKPGWTLWQSRSREELLDLYSALKQARVETTERDLDQRHQSKSAT